ELAAEHEVVDVEEVDDVGQGGAQRPSRALDGVTRRAGLGCGGGGELVCGGVRAEAGGGEEGVTPGVLLEAADGTARAGRSRRVAERVAHLPGPAVPAAHGHAVDDGRATAADVGGHVEEGAAARGPARRLQRVGEGGKVRLVADPDGGG